MINIIIKSIKEHGTPSTIEGLSNPCLCFRKSGHIALCRYCDGSDIRSKGWVSSYAVGCIYYSDITHYVEFDIESMWDTVNSNQSNLINTDLAKLEEKVNYSFGDMIIKAVNNKDNIPIVRIVTENGRITIDPFSAERIDIKSTKL